MVSLLAVCCLAVWAAAAAEPQPELTLQLETAEQLERQQDADPTHLGTFASNSHVTFCHSGTSGRTCPMRGSVFPEGYMGEAMLRSIDQNFPGFLQLLAPCAHLEEERKTLKINHCDGCKQCDKTTNQRHVRDAMRHWKPVMIGRLKALKEFLQEFRTKGLHLLKTLKEAFNVATYKERRPTGSLTDVKMQQSRYWEQASIFILGKFTTGLANLITTGLEDLAEGIAVGPLALLIPMGAYAASLLFVTTSSDNKIGAQTAHLTNMLERGLQSDLTELDMLLDKKCKEFALFDICDLPDPKEQIEYYENKPTPTPTNQIKGESPHAWDWFGNAALKDGKLQLSGGYGPLAAQGSLGFKDGKVTGSGGIGWHNDFPWKPKAKPIHLDEHDDKGCWKIGMKPISNPDPDDPERFMQMLKKIVETHLTVTTWFGKALGDRECFQSDTSCDFHHKAHAKMLAAAGIEEPWSEVKRHWSGHAGAHASGDKKDFAPIIDIITRSDTIISLLQKGDAKNYPTAVAHLANQWNGMTQGIAGSVGKHSIYQDLTNIRVDDNNREAMRILQTYQFRNLDSEQKLARVFMTAVKETAFQSREFYEDIYKRRMGNPDHHTDRFPDMKVKDGSDHGYYGVKIPREHIDNKQAYLQ